MSRRSFLYRTLIDGKLRILQAIFWDKKFSRIVEIRYLDDKGEVRAFKEDDLVKINLMASTEVKETGGDRFVFEGDIIEIEYQRGVSVCVVEWCPIKSSLILRPIRGNKPKNQLHYRLSGKKKICIIGNIYETPSLLEE